MLFTEQIREYYVGQQAAPSLVDFIFEKFEIHKMLQLTNDRCPRVWHTILARNHWQFSQQSRKQSKTVCDSGVETKNETFYLDLQTPKSFLLKMDYPTEEEMAEFCKYW